MIMGRDKNGKGAHLRLSIAAAAARMMAEDGIEDLATAKRKAARLLGATDAHALPTNEEVESELRTYLALYKRDEHSDRLQSLRELALEVMDELHEFRPYLSGSVLKGTAGRYADVDIQLFTDDPKAVELHLLNQSIDYSIDEQRLFCGDEQRLVPVLKVDWNGVPVNVTVCSPRDERSTLKASAGGRPIERATANAVAALLADSAPTE